MALHKRELVQTANLPSSRETVTRMFGDFKRKKLIEVKGATVILRNKAALEKIVGGTRSLELRTSPQSPDRKACREIYPGDEDALSQAHNCSEVGASACGGPDQCSCDKNERLVSWKCDEGTFNACSPSKGGTPRCP